MLRTRRRRADSGGRSEAFRRGQIKSQKLSGAIGEEPSQKPDAVRRIPAHPRKQHGGKGRAGNMARPAFLRIRRTPPERIFFLRESRTKQKDPFLRVNQKLHIGNLRQRLQTGRVHIDPFSVKRENRLVRV